MDLQNLAYALTQVAHNFGAVAVVAVPLYALCSMHPAGSRGLLWLALSGWALQLASGAVFGAVSWYFYGQFPDIHGIAIGALVLKVLCALVAGTPALLRKGHQQGGLHARQVIKADGPRRAGFMPIGGCGSRGPVADGVHVGRGDAPPTPYRGCALSGCGAMCAPWHRCD